MFGSAVRMVSLMTNGFLIALAVLLALLLTGGRWPPFCFRVRRRERPRLTPPVLPSMFVFLLVLVLRSSRFVCRSCALEAPWSWKP